MAVGFWSLLVALVIGNPATGAFVSLSQATLMDLAPDQRERNMARWTLAGSFGYVGGPLLVALAVWTGMGWRGLSLALAAASVPLVLAARRMPFPLTGSGESVLCATRQALGSLTNRDVLRWLVLLEASDLMLDVLHGFLALYLVDVARLSPVDAGLGVAVWTGAGLAGDAMLIPVLRHVRGAAYLRLTAVAALVIYPAFLLAPGITPKFVLLAALGLINSGWYAIPKAGLYGALPGRSGAVVAIGGIGGLAAAGIPLSLGLLAGRVGLGTTMWLLLAAPVALLALVPERSA